MTFNRIFTVLLIIGVAVAGYFYFKAEKAKTPANDQTQNQPDQSQTPAPDPAVETTPVPVPDKVVAVMETNMGSFTLTLDGKAAPKTVANFMKLAKDGFYNNLTFHRIVRDFVIQGGDPKGDGSGGPNYTVPAEIGLKHTRGAIAMARTGDAINPTKASSGSQFYIALQDLTQLDGQYTVFGYVTKGMDVVDKIGAVPTDVNPATGEQSTPLQKVIINKVTIQ